MVGQTKMGKESEKSKGLKKFFKTLGVILLVLIFVAVMNTQRYWNPNGYIKQDLSPYEYEIIYVGKTDYMNTEVAFIKMKWAGDDFQVWNALTPLGSVYKKASEYDIILVEEKTYYNKLDKDIECFYRIDGDAYKEYIESLNLDTPEWNDVRNDSDSLFLNINNEISQTTKRCGLNS